MISHEEILGIKDYIINLRRSFHAEPELSNKEYQTTLKIEEELAILKIPYQRVSETGVIGVIAGEYLREDAKVIALRADIDALCIEEKNEVAYKSKNPGVMHACGHDGHIAALLGAARLLQEHKSELKQKVLLVFQPAEEIGAGAKQCLPYLKNVDCIVGVHLASFLKTGKIMIQTSESNPSCDYFKITVKGKSCHVSKPHDGIDALYIGSQIVVGLQAIVARMTNPLDSVVVGIGKMVAGTNYNIVANEAILEGTTRAFNEETRQKVNTTVKEIAKSIGATYGAEVEVSFRDYASALVNDTEVSKELVKIATEVVGKENVILNGPKTMMADDFAEYLTEIKGSYLLVGSSSNEQTAYPHHHERFDIDEEALLIIAELFTKYVEKL